MGREIERKFLVKGDYKAHAREAFRITQAYICAAGGRTVRVRLKGDKGYITVKGPSEAGGIARFEWEREIGPEDVKELLRVALPGVIDKTRYLVPAGDGIHTFEVDEFHGDNAGLTVAEVELSSPDEPFPRPSWLGGEVTGDPRFYNSSLARNPYKNWK